MAAIGLDAGGEQVRLTPAYGYALPEPLPGRSWSPAFNGNGQYRLPDPVTGRLTSYTRASTVAKALEDTYMLDAWARRQVLIGIGADMALTVKLADALADRADGLMDRNTERTVFNDLADRALIRSGSKRAAEFGTAVHAWCEWVDYGQGAVADVPEEFRPWVAGHRRAMARAGLEVDPYYTERVVLNTKYGIAGTIDRVFLDNHGMAIMGDIKTSRSMEFSWLYFAIQLAIYHGADYVRSVDGMAWEPMPSLLPDVALISHLPREDPDASHIVPIDVAFGREALDTAMVVRSLRSRAPKGVRSVLYQVDSQDRREYLRREAIGALEAAQTFDDLAVIWDEYRDVWTDDLTEMGNRVMTLRNANGK